MHRDMRRLSNHPALGIEDGAGKIASLLDIRRKRTPPKCSAHLFGYRSAPVVKDLKINGIDGGMRKIR